MEKYKLDYSVTVHKKERVAAAVPVQEHYLPLSNIDLLFPPFIVGVFFCYTPPPHSTSITSSSMMGTLKASLAETLATFYPFAGEVAASSPGEPELLHCNNRGVDFTEAYADVELGELQLYNPDDSVGKRLMPQEKGILCIQATELKCGSLVLACTFNHRIADAYSTNMFLVAWAETARGRPISLLPSFCRSLLAPRCPARPDPSIDGIFAPASAVPPSQPSADNVSRIYHIAGDDIERMQAEASSGAHRRTKLEAFSAYLWRAVARAAAGLGAKACRLCIMVDGRPRLQQGEPAAPMEGYFGNVLSAPYGALAVAELAGMGLSDAADAVHEVVRAAATAEHFRGLVDWVERHRVQPLVARIHYEWGGEEPGPAAVVSSGRRFPVMEVDFGWGRPAMGSYYFPWDSTAAYVMPMPMPSADGDGSDWVVYMRFSRGLVERLEDEAGHVFRHLSPEHLRP